MDEISLNQSENKLRLDHTNKEIQFIKDRCEIFSNFSFQTTTNFNSLLMKYDQIKNDNIRSCSGLAQDLVILGDKYDQKIKKFDIDITNKFKIQNDRINSELASKDKDLLQLRDQIDKNAHFNFDNLPAKFSKISLENVVIMEQMTEKNNRLQQLSKKVNQISEKIEEISKYFGMILNDSNEIEIAIQTIPLSNRDNSSNQLSNFSPIPDKTQDHGPEKQTKSIDNLHNQLQSLTMEIKNISNRFPLYQKKVKNFACSY